MNRSLFLLRTLALAVGLAPLGCGVTGVGDPCIPEDEYQKGFSGYGVTETNVESRSFQCETRICLVNHFQGRVSCPYGQDPTEAAAAAAKKGASDTDPKHCRLPATETAIEVPVEPQLLQRTTDKAVYCSCRCDGPDSKARYCQCPNGFSCTKLVDNLGLGKGQLAGSYCIREGSEYNKDAVIKSSVCEHGKENCASEGVADKGGNP